MKGQSKETVMSPKSKFQSKYTAIKTPTRRAFTWEVSDSEAESDCETCTEGSSVGLDSSPCLLKTTGCGPVVSNQSCLVTEDEGNVLSQPKPISPPCTPAKKVRKKHGEELVECDLLCSEVRKLEKETKRLEKERMKELVRLEREKKRLAKEQQKQQEQQERQSRKELSEALKFLRPDQCMKHMSVCVDTGILEDAGSDEALAVLSALECKYFIEPQPVPHSIIWRREMPPGWSGTSGLEALDLDGEEQEMLVLVKPDDFLKSVYSLRKETKEAPVLTQGFAFDIADRHPAKKTCLIVIGLEPYRWHLKQKQQTGDRNRRGERRTRDPEHSVTRRQIQEALVVLQLWSHTDVLFLDTWQEFGQHIAAVTKAVAQRPFKKHTENQAFSFCTTEGGWTSGVRVEKDGKGLQQVWKRQIQQFNRVSPTMAAAVSRQFPSPRLLLQAYEKCTTEKERLHLLTGLTVRKEKYTGQEGTEDTGTQIQETEGKDHFAKDNQSNLVMQESQSRHSPAKENPQSPERFGKEESEEQDHLRKEEGQHQDSPGKVGSQAKCIVKQKIQSAHELGTGDCSFPGSLRKEQSQYLDSSEKGVRQGLDSLMQEWSQELDTLGIEKVHNANIDGNEDLEAFSSADFKGKDVHALEDTGRERRLGPDVSRRIYTFMFCTNPELVLDLGS
ncbi:probable crossover junction endonuclease EME2 isoform X2 [Ambystoma mexicanum]|uniref:probable crossover junction endonuclease EME2 isoform X2 n=1 Tax=Ambystoma mexicanum TaxID=8296 RepID=UPI0037E98F51